MNNDFSADLITLIDDEGKEHNFEIMDIIEEMGVEYYALSSVSDDKTDILQDDGDYYILEVIEENGEQQLAEVIDPKLRNKLSKIFEERFNDYFYND